MVSIDSTLKTVIDEAIRIENENYRTELDKALQEARKAKDNVAKQFAAMEDSFQQGKLLATNVSEQIFKELDRILLDNVLNNIKQDIVKSQFINHDKIQIQAYEQSIKQANGENILKYVLDINRYFLELSLKEVRTTIISVTHNHTLSLQELIIQVLNAANDIVQSSQCKDVQFVNNDIGKYIANISQLAVVQQENRFRLTDVVPLPISAPDQFKSGFKNILENLNKVQQQAQIITSGLKAKAFAGCKPPKQKNAFEII
ncbi:unnamed protein product [Didymodactylos carnosus]|uniref:Uncharacterized protein n=1 Tax=Didymodactylos carnosus TaxID=1234261 RepID=A0A8S2F6X4_9BILA|nr:unnamed protein product [Didymodactylos carnosus]CAF4159513.1 unnamed protein product [Didymodactylos carnosus]